MPNHVTTRCVVKGSAEDVAAFKDLMIGPDDSKPIGTPLTATIPLKKPTEPELFFNFERIKPMPDIVRNTQSGSQADDGMLALGFKKPNRYPEISAMFGPKWEHPRYKSWGVSNAAELKAYLEKNSPQSLAEGQRCIDAYKATGYHDWYEWSIGNWGTKWNSYDFVEVRHLVKEFLGEPVDAEYEFLFDTAWSFPSPIFVALYERFPDLRFECWAIDEGYCFALTAVFHKADGIMMTTEYQGDASQDEMDRIYTKVHGAPPERYDEEDEEEPSDPGVVNRFNGLEPLED
jgi:hypothetical protein